MGRKYIWGNILAFELAISIPYLLATWWAGEDWVFAGLLQNPVDGNTYLAKMMQGAMGNWLAVLPYTAVPGEPSFQFSFYNLLGHIGAWLGLTPPWMFHIARVLSAGVLIWMVTRLALTLWPEDAQKQKYFVFWCCWGSGLGWLAALFGAATMDFWVPEAYIFLSSYTNPHFPLGIACLIEVYILLVKADSRWREGRLLGLGVALSFLSPFGLLLAAILIVAWTVWMKVKIKQWNFWPIVSFCSIGGPSMIYQTWVIQTHPVLAAWNVQNVTPAPGVGDLVVGLSPALLFALAGCWLWIKQRKIDLRWMLALVWVFSSLILIYLPFALQRRFSFGIMIVLCALAIEGYFHFAQHAAKKELWLKIVIGLAVMTNLFLILGAIGGAASHHKLLYQTRAESDALAWIKQNTGVEDVVLASPEFSLWIPSFTGRRVVYGHPFETAQAEVQKGRVKAYYEGVLSPSEETQWFSEQAVQWVVMGPREKTIGSRANPPGEVKYDQGNIQIIYLGKHP